MLRSLIVCAALLVAPAAGAQELDTASPQTIHDEARYLNTLDGPAPREHRALYIWRAPRTPGGVLLPTLYVADGAAGVYVFAARLRPAIEAGLIPAVQIIGFEADQPHRTEEYAAFGHARFRRHEDWVLNVVIPWAEHNARASPVQRAVGGFSNGADFAIGIASDHPEVFSAVIAHSPVSIQMLNLDQRAAAVRWNVTAGRMEQRGYALASAHVLAAAVSEHHGALRICTGNWPHAAQSWIDLSPGAVAWAFNFAAPERIATLVERESCSTRDEAAP